jgi:glutamyl-tRNA synthetase
MPKSGSIDWDDKVRGKISFLAKNIQDRVIIRANGRPTYNFASIVDDILMEISHIIRGEEHISNTPFQLSVCTALGKRPPVFAHLPILRNKEHKKLSKRRDPVAVQWFRQQGYLPEAILNFLALQGWSHPEEKDVFSLQEFVKRLTLNRIKTSAPVFDLKKLDWINGDWIRTKDTTKLARLLKKEFAAGVPVEIIDKTLPLVKDRLKRLSEFGDLVEYFHKTPTVKLQLLVSQSRKESKAVSRAIDQVISSCENLTNWNHEEIEKVGQKLLETSGWSARDLFMTIRVALSGRTATPPLFEMMEVLGKQETLKRLKSSKQLLTTN